MDDAQQDMLGRDKFIAEFLEYSTRTEDHIISFPGKRLSSITTLELCSAGDSFIELAFDERRIYVRLFQKIGDRTFLVIHQGFQKMRRIDRWALRDKGDLLRCLQGFL